MKVNTTKCHICGEKYLKHALKQHHSQMAGKEAQYLMADLFYKDESQRVKITKSEIMKRCPHWKYILANPIIQTNPVARKHL